MKIQQGQIFKDRNNNEYLIIENNEELGIVKFYKNIKDQIKSKNPKGYKVERQRIDIFTSLIQDK